MLVVVNAVLYLAALTLSLCVLVPVPEGAGRRLRVARVTLACGGGAAIVVAIVLSIQGHRVASAAVGCVALVIVGACLAVALSRRSTPEREDGDEGSGGGGGGWPQRPVPPAPPEPAGCPPTDWSEFDRVREAWGRAPQRPAPREPVGT